MLQTLSYIINVAPDGVPQVVKLSQNENGRTLAFALTGVGTVNIPSGSTVTISGTKPDGVVYSATGTLSGNVASFSETTQMTAVSGIWPAKITVTYNGETIATCKIVMAIDPDPVAPGSVPSSSQLNGLVAEAQQYATYAKEEAYGSPLVAATAAAMTDKTRVYVYTGSETGKTAGHWYFWNGSAWTDGGVYNSQGINTDTTLTLAGMAADAKAVGDEFTHVKQDNINYGNYVVGEPDLVVNVEIINGYTIDADGNEMAQYVSYRTNFIPVKTGAYTIYYTSGTESNVIMVHGYDSSMNWVSMLVNATGMPGHGNDVIDHIGVNVPNGICYIIFTTRKTKPFKYIVEGNGTTISSRLKTIEETKADKATVKGIITSQIQNSIIDVIWKNEQNNFVEGYLNSSGNVAYASDAYVTDFFEVTSTKPIFIKMQYDITSSASDVCFYDANKAFISYHRVAMDMRKCIGLIAPQNAKYCRFDYLRAFPNPVAYAEQLVNIMPNNKSSNNTVIGEIASADVIIASPSRDEFVTGWLTSSGTINGNEAKTSRYIKIQANTPIIKHIGRAVTVNQTICFYDNTLSFVSYSSNLDSTIPIPENASYFSYSIGDTYTDRDYYLTQRKSVATPTQAELYAQGVKTGLSQSINIAYRGLLAGFGNSETALRIFGTKNFNYFEEIGMAYRPAKGLKGCRDPFIFVYGEWFYIFYSNAKSYTDVQNSIGICRTRNFLDYEEFDPLVLNNDYTVCWAPSVFEENGSYYLTVTTSFTTYQNTETTIYDFNIDTLTASNPRNVSIGESTRKIDFHFYKFNGYYYAVGKYDDTGTTVIGKSTTLNGPYTVLANQQYCGHHEEGQIIIRLDNGYYRLYINDYINQIIYYVDIPDISNPTQNVGALKSISDDSPVALFHVSVIDFNRPYSFESV